jgi:hypothetical protein
MDLIHKLNIVDTWTSDKDKLYITVKCPSVGDAKALSIIIALLSARHMRSVNNFVKLSSFEQTKSEAEILSFYGMKSEKFSWN